jgi:U3 small nucleolar RNA-associated protein 7
MFGVFLSNQQLYNCASNLPILTFFPQKMPSKGMKSREKKAEKVRRQQPKDSVERILPIGKYSRGTFDLQMKNKKKISKIRQEQTREANFEAAKQTSATEILLPSTCGSIETTDSRPIYKLKHKEIVQNVDMNTAKNAFSFQLHEFGPYFVDYSRNGR